MKKSKVVAVIQARMNSTRLPGKVLLPLGPDNKSVLWWMATRAGLAELVDEVVIATTQAPSNAPIMDFCNENEITCCGYGGDEGDVIGRVLTCADFNEADIIVDLTSDCPMVDPRHIDYLVNVLTRGNYDYASNCVYRDWPDGLDVQVYWTNVLRDCINIHNPKQHAGWNIHQHEEFNCYHSSAPLFPLNMRWPNLGLTLDTQEDYDMMKKLFNKFGHDPTFTAESVVDFLSKNPDWITNAKVRRKEPEEG